MPDFSFAKSGEIVCITALINWMRIPAERFAATMRCVIVSPEPVKIEAVNVLSTARKIGAIGRVASRLTTEAAGRSRTFGAVVDGVRATTRSFRVAMRQLWLEVTGTVFLVMALMGSAPDVTE